MLPRFWSAEATGKLCTQRLISTFFCIDFCLFCFVFLHTSAALLYIAKKKNHDLDAHAICILCQSATCKKNLICRPMMPMPCRDGRMVEKKKKENEINMKNKENARWYLVKNMKMFLCSPFLLRRVRTTMWCTPFSFIFIFFVACQTQSKSRYVKQCSSRSCRCW